MTGKTFALTAASGAALVARAVLGSGAQAQHGLMMAGPTRAVAVLHATQKGGKAHGKVTFTHTAKGIHVVADIEGLTPGPHGFHIHEYGDSSSPDGMSAGGHFNPHGLAHGGPTATKRHVGDLGNIEADANGHAKLDIIDPALGFSGATSIIGRGLVVHAKADDLKSQPAGAAGDRVAIGTIGIAMPTTAAAK